MNESIFDEKDMNQMKNRGISLEKVISQIKMFEKGTPYVNLNQPCTIGNGIRSVTEDELKKLISIFEEYAPKKRLTKFVPASGAASRMFKILLRFNNEFSMIQRDIIASEAQEENGDRLYMITFMDGIRKFAFYDDLKAVMAGDGIDSEAVDLDNKPFRLNDGALLFRPSGHGALIENLNNLQEDIIFIKNVDNVAPDKLNEQIFQWKKMLGGYLIKTQQKIFSYIKRLCAGTVNTELLQQAFKFAVNELCVSPSANRNLRSNQAKKDFLISVFNRPIRVCGMVKNTGEPGGGPFWVEAEDGSLSIQIVENAQVNPESKEQQEILSSSSHSNPVDIVCAVRDFKGNSFDLRQYVDTGAVFIAHKSKDGNKLKALELPGLWNGAMAYWNTIFVEVPLITFNPVKTVNDLLRKEHQLG